MIEIFLVQIIILSVLSPLSIKEINLTKCSDLVIFGIQKAVGDDHVLFSPNLWIFPFITCTAHYHMSMQTMLR